jgi:hypothetical protein
MAPRIQTTPREIRAVFILIGSDLIWIRDDRKWIEHEHTVKAGRSHKIAWAHHSSRIGVVER